MAQLNGIPIPESQLQTLALTNYGHFTSMRVEDGQVRGLSDHLDRLRRDCQQLFGQELAEDQLREYLRAAVDGQPGVWSLRATVFDPDFSMGSPSKNGAPAVLVTMTPTGEWPPAPLAAQAVRFTRTLPAVKHVGLFDQLRLRRDAQLAGYDDALFYDENYLISEGVTWNVGFYDGQNVIWPDSEVLPGVTMKLLQQVHDDSVVASIDVREIGQGMEAAFATNVTVGVRPISRINDLSFPADHEILDELRKEFLEIPPEALV